MGEAHLTPGRLVRGSPIAQASPAFHAKPGQDFFIGQFPEVRTFVAGHELFWGDDRLEDAISWYQTGVVA